MERQLRDGAALLRGREFQQYAAAIVLIAFFLGDVATRAGAVSYSFREQRRRLAGGYSAMTYSGGKVLSGSPLDVYLIYYGAWPQNSGQTLIETFIKSLSSDSGPQGKKGDATVKSWWGIMSGYYMKSGKTTANISSKVRLAGTVRDQYSLGKGPFSRTGVADIVSKHMGKEIPYNPAAVYMVLGWKDVTVKDVCSGLCAFHVIGSSKKGEFAAGYATIGLSAPGCGCLFQNVSVNGDPNLDTLIDFTAHEIVEAATNPFFNGWASMDSITEVADYCDGTYDFAPWKAKTGYNSKKKKYLYNLAGLGNTKYFIQPVYNPLLKRCSMQTNS